MNTKQLIENIIKKTIKEQTEINEVENLALKLWSKIKNKINTLFNDGSATCPYATYEVAKYFKELNYNVSIIDGGYKGEEGHWYPIITKDLNPKFTEYIIVDLGNNLEDRFLDSGKIEHIITKYPNSNYSKDKETTFKRYIEYMNSIGYKFK